MATAACCVENPIFFKMLWFFESRHHHLLESIAKIAHFDILTLSWRKKKSLFKGCGEKTAITRKILGLAPWNYLHSIENQILVTIKLKRDIWLHKKSSRARIFFATLVKNSAFCSIFWLKKVKYLTFNILHLVINIKSWILKPLRVHGHQLMFTTGI